jgi:hypothetical protein
MLKKDELTKPNSCLNKARPDERIFVLLARDKVAPVVIREWCRLRRLHGLNTARDPQITEALECADLMEKERPVAGPAPLSYGTGPGPDWRTIHRDNAAKLEPALTERAVAWLRENLRLPDEMVADIKANPEWWIRYHHSPMMIIRDELRSHGFGEKEFGIDSLDYYAIGLVERAVGVE